MSYYIYDTLRMLVEGLASTLPAAVALWLVVSGVSCLTGRRRRPSLTLLGAICYAALLLWGTCFSRVDSLADLLTWRAVSIRGFFVNDFRLTGALPVWHELMNVLLFMPLGLFGMVYSRPPRRIAIMTACGLALSCFIEAFQGFHGLQFDVGDVFTNTLGTLLGCYAFVPYAAVRRWFGAIVDRREAHE